MSHDRGCWHCTADDMADKRACWRAKGDKCVKAGLFEPGGYFHKGPPAPKPVPSSPDALKVWAEPAAPSNAEISAVSAITFALTIDDHFERHEWLQSWERGDYANMRHCWPEFDKGAWRKS